MSRKFTTINSMLATNTIYLTFLTILPVNGKKIISISDDGTNISLSGLQINANEMTRAAMISLVLFFSLQLFHYLLFEHSPETNILPHFCFKRYRYAPFKKFITTQCNIKTLELHTLDIYKIEVNQNYEETEREIEPENNLSNE